MQTAEYTITRHDAKMFKELIDFLGGDVFDRWKGEGKIEKSEPFLAKIRGARKVLEEIGAYDYDFMDEKEPAFSLYWEAPFDIRREDAATPLARVVGDRPGVVFKQVEIYDALESLHYGYMQFGLDEASGKICALIIIEFTPDLIFIGPQWLDIEPDLPSIISKFVGAISVDMVNRARRHPPR